MQSNPIQRPLPQLAQKMDVMSFPTSSQLCLLACLHKSVSQSVSQSPLFTGKYSIRFKSMVLVVAPLFYLVPLFYSPFNILHTVDQREEVRALILDLATEMEKIRAAAYLLFFSLLVSHTLGSCASIINQQGVPQQHSCLHGGCQLQMDSSLNISIAIILFQGKLFSDLEQIHQLDLPQTGD